MDSPSFKLNEPASKSAGPDTVNQYLKMLQRLGLQVKSRIPYAPFVGQPPERHDKVPREGVGRQRPR